jgi:hypothetical protein
LAICTLVILFGPQLAEWGLAVLGCPLGYGAAGAGCGGVLALPARPLGALAGAAPPLETCFVLVQQLWPLLLVWGIAIVLSTRADRRPAALAQPEDQRESVAAAATATATVAIARMSAEEARAQWVADREREQASDALAAQRTVRQQLMAETRFIGATALVCWLLICGFLGFCLTFGLPLLGGVHVEIALDFFGCGQSTGIAYDPMMLACPALEERFQPYRQPFFGALLSPVWLFTQFGDVLLVWLGAILLLAALPLFRLGFRPVLRAYPVMSITLAVIASLAALAMAAAWLAPMNAPGGRFHEPVPAIAFIESAAILILSGLLALGLGLSVLIIALVLARRSRRADASTAVRKR